ncbi:RNA polymerase factor sigma-54 [Niallia sp. Krafla_26]|uniref:RNA polymerase factor sigma-54 n=1 Tax=Niallia sp. Krafla_26 TaxID=3064703 RepID=UPI003D165567
MELKPGLWQQQTVKLAMTQELKQAITLLQYSSIELYEFLENKALENPLMQVETTNVEVMDPRYDRVKKTKNTSQTDRQTWLEQIANKDKTTIRDFAKQQINFTLYDNQMRRVLLFLLNSLDENGYIQISMEEVASILSVPIEVARQALEVIHSLEPAGIGARNLQECILLQIDTGNEFNDLAIKIIDEYFSLFAEKRWKQIAKELKVELTQIQEVYDYVQTLNPRPGSDFQTDHTTYIVPDVVIKWEGEELTVSIYDGSLPKIQFNESYFRQFQSNSDEKVKRFLQEKQQDFQWMLKSIEQRKETILKVTLKIVEKQPDYFRRGPDHLKPLTMKEISEELGIHESTVSRTVREKYAQTPFGTVELKSFFSSTIKTTSAEETSSTRVKKEIQQLIDSESKAKPLSDQDLVGLLKQSGMIVSRRTIAKYRDQLGIPSSSKRKRFE